HKNDTIRGPDLIGYKMQNLDIPSDDDLLVIAEVKTRSKTVSNKVIGEAFGDAKKHYISRLANSLATMQHWLKQQGDDEEAARIARFLNPHALPFRKRLNPCVVHNSATWDDDFLKALPEEHNLKDSVVVLVICVEELPKWIDAVYEAAVRSLG
ncbi:MAG: hypothetical protein ACC700_15660, partial [Anaerolineales bacterium]